MDGDFEEFQQADAHYREHLEQFDVSPAQDLWKYFYWDFFHDGEIEKIEVSPDFRSLEMKLNAANIRKLEGADYRYLNAGFTIIWKGIRSLRFEPELESETSPFPLRPKPGSLEFRYGEVNTHPASYKTELSGPEEERPSSLLVELIGGHSTWLEMIFDEVRVFPEEPLAFSLLENDSSYDMPIFRGNDVAK